MSLARTLSRHALPALRRGARALAAVALAASAVTCEPGPDFSVEAVSATPVGRGLPRGFLLGVATAAHQIEGNNNNDDWWDWEAGSFADGRPHIVDGTRSGRATDSWLHWDRDHTNLGYLGANAYRLSLEWSRLEPTEGAWDQAAADNYRAQLMALRARGITPVVVVHHYTFPRWAAVHGGWEWDGLNAALDRHARRLGAAFGDLVDTWITVNEPNAIITASYIGGIWPPGVTDTSRAWAVFVNIMRAHAAIAHALRAGDTADADGDGRATFLGMAHNITLFDTGSSSPVDEVLVASADDTFNESVPRAVSSGRFTVNVPGVVSLDVNMPELVGTFDFFGINYYRRDFIRANLLSAMGWSTYTPQSLPISDSEHEIYPEGLYRTLVRYARYGWPIIVTENGIADEHDTQRDWYLRSHVYAVERAIADGADVRGYIHWSLTDNWEWSEGRSARYGLFALDYDAPDLTRTPRPSTESFRTIARNMGLAPR